ncbi:MAG: hypothetical protein NXH85_15570 [Pseudomonadaceae bacterium]|nr:hypothetical protein [Pseudomonadaceae bacterium]
MTATTDKSERPAERARRRLAEQRRATVLTPEVEHVRDAPKPDPASSAISVLAATLGITLLGERLIDGQSVPDDGEIPMAETVSAGELLDASSLYDQDNDR